jgi:hypothetical protein
MSQVLPLDLAALWREDLDTDGNGQLDDNELITLVGVYVWCVCWAPLLGLGPSL